MSCEKSITSSFTADRTLPPEELEVIHRRRGFNGIGYHYYVRKDGTVLGTRSFEIVGAHCRGHNAHSIGICYEGGLDIEGRPADTRTPEQRSALHQLVTQLLKQFPDARLCGHRDLSPDLNHNGEIEPEEWIKQCPCFEVAREF